MPQSRHRSSSQSSRQYLRRRSQELATPAVRAISDPLAAWVRKRIRLDGRPFSFDGHEYLRAIYDDTCPHCVLSKAAQIGGTVWALIRSLHACLNGLNVIYYFPTRTDVLDFSKARVSPLLYDNPFLLKRMTDTDTVGLKRIGDAHLYFRGMQSQVGMKSVPADQIVFDELDEATPDARQLAWERLGHSDYKRVLELSNPSLPGYGIDEQYQKSDQRHWTLKCPACGHWTCLEREFPTKLSQEVRIILPRNDGTWFRACVRCGGELDLSQGEWVADFPGRSIHGYRISQLYSAKIDPGALLQDYRTTHFPDRFYQLKIGIPWANLDARVDVGTVLSLVGDVAEPEDDRGHIYMGVDPGKQLHVVILRKASRDSVAQLIHLEVCQHFEDLDGLMERFQVERCVIDALPETHPTRGFALRHPGKVSMCFFNEQQRGSARWNAEEHTVLVNRTEALDASRAVVREKQVILSRNAGALEEFARHMAADAKQLDEDPDTGAKKYRYVRTGEDHFSLAFTYACLAVSRPRVEAAEVVIRKPLPNPGRASNVWGGWGQSDVTDEELRWQLEARDRNEGGPAH